jgi:hypothetical protein
MANPPFRRERRAARGRGAVTRVCAQLAGAMLGALAAAQERAAPANLRLEGRVVDMRGEPVPMADVWLATQREPDAVLARAHADGDGCFVLPRVPQREFLLVSATAAGRCIASVRTAPDPGAVVIDLAEADAVRGTLRDRAGRPVAGATVEVTSAPQLQSLRAADAAVTAADGTFALAKAPLGPVVVSAIVPGEGLASATFASGGAGEVQLAPDGRAQTSVELQVTGLTPEVAARARIDFDLFGGQRLLRLPPPWRQLRLDEHGCLRLQHVPDLDIEATVVVPGFVVVPGGAQLLETHGPHRFEFRAEARDAVAQTAGGMLRRANGEPLAGVRLGVSVGAERTETAVDERGAFRFAHHGGDRLSLSIEVLDDAWVIDRPSSSGPDLSGLHARGTHSVMFDAARAIDLHAVAASEICGRVCVADGGPAPFAEVVIRAQVLGEDWGGVAWTRTDRDGQFRLTRLHHLDAPLRAEVQSRAGSVTGATFALAAPGSRVDLGTLRLAAPAVVEGVARDADGGPLAGALVRLRVYNRATDRGKWVETLSDRLGRYRFACVPQGAVVLQLVSLSADGERITAAAGPLDVAPGKALAADLVAARR